MIKEMEMQIEYYMKQTKSNNTTSTINTNRINKANSLNT